MASNHISITNTTTIGANCNSAISQTRAALESVRKMWAILNEYGDDNTSLDAVLGVPDGEGINVRANFLNAKGVLEGLDIAYFINRLGQ